MVERKSEVLCHGNGILLIEKNGTHRFIKSLRQLTITLKSTSRVVMNGIYIKQMNLDNTYTNLKLGYTKMREDYE
jgi:hypothetical protein